MKEFLNLSLSSFHRHRRPYEFPYVTILSSPPTTIRVVTEAFVFITILRCTPSATPPIPQCIKLPSELRNYSSFVLLLSES